MDFHLKQWRNQQQHESEEQHSTKMPKLVLHHPVPAPDPESHHQQSSPIPPPPAPLPFFLPNTKLTNLSDSTTLPHSNNTANKSFPRMGSHFSLSQWQELELQALIFRYMLVGASVPSELLLPIKKSLLHSSSPYFLHQHYQSTALLQTGYWGRGAMDPEPGRCRRTDGKKWRCSRDVVAGQKYCERHMHRGRNRSRKPVELPTPTSAGGGNTNSGGGGGGSFFASQSLATASLKSPFNLLHLNERCSSGTKNEDKSLFESENHVGGDGRSGGKMLRHFFDDWPRSLQQESDNGENNIGGSSSTCLSISMPGNNNSNNTSSTSDISLKLSTGYGEEQQPCPTNVNVGLDTEQQQQQQVHLSWVGGWNSGNQVASMGGPLAEALRSSSTSTSSPTSVLHQLPRSSTVSETSYIST